MPVVEITSNEAYFNVAKNTFSGSLGIGTTNPESTLHIVAPKSFQFNSNQSDQFDTGSYDIRMLSTSSDGNTVVVSRGNASFDNVLEVYFKQDDDWVKTTLTIQNLPNGVYQATNYGAIRQGSRGYISNDGTRIVASSGKPNNNSINANVCEVFHYVNNTWVSKAYIHASGCLGWGSAISGDGNTIALTSIFGPSVSRVYIYRYNIQTDTWDQSLSREYYNEPDQVTLNYDGTILAVSCTTIPATNLSVFGNSSASIVRILKYTNGQWNDANDDVIITPPPGILNWHYYGKSIRFSKDGLTLVVGAPGFNNTSYNYNVLSAVFVYKAPDLSWQSYSSATLQPASYLNPSFDDRYNQFGNVISVNEDGTIIVAGAQSADVDDLQEAGRTWVFQYINNTWTIIGILDGTLETGRFGSAVDLTADGYSLFVASRGAGWQNPQFTITWGVFKYDFSVFGSVMKAIGNTWLSDMIVDGTTVLSGSINMNVHGDCFIRGNVGIGTTSSAFTMRVESSYTYSTASYEVIPYQNYMLWDAYTNRVNLPIHNVYGSPDYAVYKVPDIGLDFFINGKNYRNAIYVAADGIVSFGGFKANTGYDDEFYPQYWEFPAFAIGVGDQDVNSVSYYSGTYDNEQALYIFYDAISSDFPSFLQKWCLILQSNNSMVLLINTIHTFYPSSIGIALGDNKSWMLQLPRNGTALNPALTSVGYTIHINQNRNIGSYVRGSMQVSDVLHVTTIGSGTIVPYPPIALNANVTTVSDAPYGNGEYVLSISPAQASQPFQLFANDYDSLFTFNQTAYNSVSGQYVGNTFTTFTDYANASTSIAGAWVQIQLPNAIRVYSYGITPYKDALNGAPYQYVLLGSLDGDTWKLLDDHRTNPTVYLDSLEVINLVSTSNVYKYYRFVVNSTINLGQYNTRPPEWSSLRFYAYNDPLQINNHMQVVGSVGIGTSTPQAPLHVIGNMTIQGNILPTACNVYDLGSSNYRFRDLYLSGNTIDLEGIQIAKDNDTGGISFKDGSNNYLDARIGNLIAYGNVGIGTTTPGALLEITTQVTNTLNLTSSFATGTADIRHISTSSDGNTVVVSVAVLNNGNLGTYDTQVLIFTNNAGTWESQLLNIQDVPDGVYSGGHWWYRHGARGIVSSDGMRILAMKAVLNNKGQGGSIQVYHKESGTWVSKAYIHQAGSFGYGGAISGDGNTVAITAPLDNSNNSRGTIYVYKYNANTDTWDLSLSRQYELWPDQISLNYDGTILALSCTGIAPNYEDRNNANASVAVVRILKYTNGSWNSAVNDEVIYPPNGTIVWQFYGKTITLSSDGSTLLVGAPGYNTNVNNTLNSVFVYKSVNGSWTNLTPQILQPPSYTSPSADDYINMFGNSIAVSSDGSVAVVGALRANTNVNDAGRVWIFKYSNNIWTSVNIIDGLEVNNQFGSAVSITSDGLEMYIATRGVGNASTSGIKNYSYKTYGTAMISIGDIVVPIGNVGIGTSLPSSKLHVFGDAIIQGGSTCKLEVKGLINNVNLKALDKRTKASYASAMNVVNTWSDHTNLNNEVTMYEICWSPELSIFCAVGSSSLTNTNVLTSPDGVQWTSRTSADSNAIWYGICWSPELSRFCAVGGYGNTYVMTSPDGINWTSRNSVDNSGYWTSVCWSPELSLFCAVGSLGSTYNIMTSPDGINWTGRTGQNSINPYSEWRNICWSPELSLFCAVSWAGTRVVTSPDGINWTGRTSANDNTDWESICWSPELSLFCAAGYGGGSYAVMTSPDGIQWTGHNSVNNVADWWSICWSPELSLFCCVGTRYGGNYNLMTSPDGINWTSHTGTDPNAAWYGICWSPELSIFTVVGDGSSTNGIMTSAIGMPNSLNVVKALPSHVFVDKMGNVGIGTAIPTSKLDVNGNVQIGHLLKYPPVPLTNNITNVTSAPYGNGTYTLTSSETSYLTSDLYYAFDNKPDDWLEFDFLNVLVYNLSGNYIGGTSTTYFDFSNNIASVAGVWIQLQHDSSIILSKYSIFGSYENWLPQQFVLLGSVDGITWILLDDRRTSNISFTYSEKIFELPLQSQLSAYTYYRMVITKVKSPSSGQDPPALLIPEIAFYVKNTSGEFTVNIDSIFNRPIHLIGNMTIHGNIIPSACNIYDLGSSTYRFRDLYLSGTTIDLEGTTISKDETTGGISITDGNNGFVDTTARNIISNGNVAIGSSITTQARLYVQHTGTGNIMQVDDSSSPDTTPFVINQDGNVGVGTSTPQKKLHVVGDGRLEGDLFVSQTITASTMISSNLYVVGDVVTMNTLSSNTEQMVITNSGTGPALKVIQTGLMSIHTIAEFVDAEDGLAMIIANGGSVGIGTSTPQSKLDVNGTVQATEFTGNGAAITSLNAGNISTGTLVVGRGGIGTVTLTANKLLVGNGTSAITQPTELHWDGANLGIGTITPLAKTHIYHTGNGDIFRVDDQASDTTPVVITQDGNVGIGTNTNVLSRLHVPYGGGGLGKNTVLIGNNETTFGDTIFSLQFGAQSKDAGMGVYSTSRGVFAKQGLGIHITDTDEFSIRSGGWAKLLGVDTSHVYIRGNLGIGNTQPSKALDVSGSIRVTANVGVGTATPLASMHVYSTGAYDIMRVDDSTAPDSTPFIINQDGNVGIGTITPKYTFDVPTSIGRIGNQIFETFERTLTTTANDTTIICNLSSSNGAFTVRLVVVHSESGSSVSKIYDFAIGYGETAGAWRELLPISSTGAYSSNDFTVDINVAASSATSQVQLRLRRTGGTTTNLGFTCSVIIYESFRNQITITDVSTAGTGGTTTGLYNSTQVTQVDGRVGIASASPTELLDVNGTAKATTFIGSGAGISSLNAANIASGTIGNSYLPASISVTSLAGNGAAITALNAANIATGTINNAYLPANINLTGNLGVGTATSLAAIHVYTTGAYDIMRVDDSTAPDITPFIINQDGNVGIGTNNPLTYKLAVNGAIYATGDVSGFGTLSDIRYKENIKELDRSLHQIRELRPVDFHWKSNVYYEQRKGTQDVGFIAQEMEEVLPLVIRKLTPPGVEEELKGVAYEKLTPYIIKAIQELDQNYQQLRKDFAELQQKLSG